MDKQRLGRALRRLRRNKQMMIGGVIVLLFLLVAAFAPLVAPYDPLAQDIPNRLQPPASLGQIAQRVFGIEAEAEAEAEVEAEVEAEAEERAPLHLMGTDNLGRDVFSRVLFGTRVSLMVGVVSTLLGAAVGVFLGILAGYYGKAMDSIVMRAMDILLAFPGILLALAIVAILGSGTEIVIVAVSVFAVPTFARIVRASTLVVKKLEYIDAIRAVGARDFRIIFGHILPNVLSPIIVQATLNVGGAIVVAAALSFLGVGTQAPTPEWGSMVNIGRQFMLGNPHMVIFPGLAIFLLVVGINLFGDGLRDFLEPKKTK